MLRSRSLIVLLVAMLAVAVPAGATLAQTGPLQEITEDVSQGNAEFANAKGGADCQSLRSVSDPVRAGGTAFRHEIENCGERSEFAAQRTEYGETYSEGWSIYLPPDWESTGRFTIVNQWASYPNVVDFVGDYCGGNGHKMSFGSSGELTFSVAVPNENRCERYAVADASEMLGQWTDFVLVARWTESSDGFLRLHRRTGDGEFTQSFDYRGATWWQEEGPGPYFKMGAYKGEPGNGATVLYTDEYRLAAGEAFATVAPGGGSPPPPPPAASPSPPGEAPTPPAGTLTPPSGPETPAPDSPSGWQNLRARIQAGLDELALALADLLAGTS